MQSCPLRGAPRPGQPSPAHLTCRHTQAQPRSSKPQIRNPLAKKCFVGRLDDRLPSNLESMAELHLKGQTDSLVPYPVFCSHRLGDKRDLAMRQLPSTYKVMMYLIEGELGSTVYGLLWDSPPNASSGSRAITTNFKTPEAIMTFTEGGGGAVRVAPEVLTWAQGGAPHSCQGSKNPRGPFPTAGPHRLQGLSETLERCEQEVSYLFSVSWMVFGNGWLLVSIRKEPAVAARIGTRPNITGCSTGLWLPRM